MSSKQIVMVPGYPKLGFQVPRGRNQPEKWVERNLSKDFFQYLMISSSTSKNHQIWQKYWRKKIFAQVALIPLHSMALPKPETLSFGYTESSVITNTNAKPFTRFPTIWPRFYLETFSVKQPTIRYILYIVLVIFFIEILTRKLKT